MSETEIRAAVYARISDDRENDEKGVKRQLKDGRALVANRGGTVVLETVDNDISALKGKHRVGYEELMTLAESGAITHIVIWQTSRLWRNRRERADGIERLAKARVSVLACKGPDLDMTTAYGRGMAGLVGEFDTMESEVKSERIQAKVLELAEAGAIANGGPRPFGYRRVFLGEGSRRKILRDEIDEAEAEVIRKAAQRFLAGDSLRSIVVDLNQAGVKTSTGRFWTLQAMRIMLRSGRIAGLREHQRQVIGKAVWPAIIDEETHHLLRAKFDGRVRNPGARVRTHYLTGYVFCSGCVEKGIRMGVKTHHGALKYVCAPVAEGGCNGRVIGLADLEELVGGYIVGRLDSEAFRVELAARGRVDDTVAARIRSEIDGDQARLDALGAALAFQSAEAMPEAVAALTAIRARMNQLRQDLARTADVPAVVRDAVGITLDEFKARPLDAKRALLAFLVGRILIAPGRRGLGRFDASRVDIDPAG